MGDHTSEAQVWRRRCSMIAYWTICFLVIDRRLTITRASLPDVGDLVLVDRLKHQRHEQHRHGEISQARDQAIADDIGRLQQSQQNSGYEPRIAEDCQGPDSFAPCEAHTDDESYKQHTLPEGPHGDVDKRMGDD